jgi:hypothetical protein
MNLTMTEIFNPNYQEQSPEEEFSKQERLEMLNSLFDEAQKVFETEGRELAKAYLPQIYDDLIGLNKRDKEDWETLWAWNPEGSLTREEFDSLNLRRKKLSNDIGIRTATGIRHDLNEIQE